MFVFCASPVELCPEEGSEPIFIEMVADELNEFQPAAVLTLEPGDLPYLWIRPAVVSFETSIRRFGPKSRERSEQKLASFGIDAEALARIDELASEIADVCDYEG